MPWAGPGRPGLCRVLQAVEPLPPPSVPELKRASLRSRRPEKPLAGQSLPSTGQRPEQEMHVKFGSKESDLLRSCDTSIKPFMPTTHSLLWPAGSPALTSCTKELTIPSLLCWTGQFEVGNSCTHLFHAFLILGSWETAIGWLSRS